MEPADKKAVAEAARLVLAMQDACNLTGLLYDAPLIASALCAATRGKGTEARNRHPLARVYLHKLCDLAGLGVIQSFTAEEEDWRVLGLIAQDAAENEEGEA